MSFMQKTVSIHLLNKSLALATLGLVLSITIHN